MSKDLTPQQEMTKIKKFIRDALADKRRLYSEEDVQQLSSILRITDLSTLQQAFKFYTEWMNFEKKGLVKVDGILFANVSPDTKIRMKKLNSELKSSYRDGSGVRCLWHTPKGVYTEPGRAALRYPKYNYKDIIRISNDPLNTDFYCVDIIIESFYEEDRNLPYIIYDSDDYQNTLEEPQNASQD